MKYLLIHLQALLIWFQLLYSQQSSKAIRLLLLVTYPSGYLLHITNQTKISSSDSTTAHVSKNNICCFEEEVVYKPQLDNFGAMFTFFGHCCTPKTTEFLTGQVHKNLFTIMLQLVEPMTIEDHYPYLATLNEEQQSQLWSVVKQRKDSLHSCIFHRQNFGITKCLQYQSCSDNRRLGA